MWASIAGWFASKILPTVIGSFGADVVNGIVQVAQAELNRRDAMQAGAMVQQNADKDLELQDVKDAEAARDAVNNASADSVLDHDQFERH